MNVITEENIKADCLEKIGHSWIQHGKNNNRIYLLGYNKKEDHAWLINQLNELAYKNGYSKIIAKVPASVQPAFLGDGYEPEAYIPGFYNGYEGVFFMAKFIRANRSVIRPESLSSLEKLLKKSPDCSDTGLPGEFFISILNPEQTGEMAKLYQQVFITYPFPITNSAYLEKTMKEGKVIYFGIRHKGKLIGISSAEVDAKNKNAEMTDFAVLPHCRGKKLAFFLLGKMEDEMKKRGYQTLYTMARLNNPGMTRTFIKRDYHFSGLLKNNTNICGQIESLNVFYKNLSIC